MIARGSAEVAEALALRTALFRDGQGSDADAFDAACVHVLVRRQEDGVAVGGFRVLRLGSGAEIGRSYAAQFYDLAGLARYPRPMVELGRFCVRPEARDPDVLRVAFAALGQLVDEAGAGLIVGCTSFPGTEVAPHRAALRYLATRHLGPPGLRPSVRAPEVVRLAELAGPVEARSALKAMPPLLRSYLGLGGWVGDHAVIDRDLGTLHVFTGVDVAAIPPARVRALRSLATLAGPEGTN